MKAGGGGVGRGRRVEERTDYLGRLGELLTELFLNLLQPAVGLQREGRGGSVRTRYAAGQIDTKRGRVVTHTHTHAHSPVDLCLLAVGARGEGLWPPWPGASPHAHVCQQVVTGMVHSGRHSPLIPGQQFIT